MASPYYPRLGDVVVGDRAKDKLIRVSSQTKDTLDAIKHPGQSYDGVIQELVEFWEQAHRVEEERRALVTK